MKITFNIADRRATKLTEEFNARVADGSFPATKEVNSLPVATTEDDFAEAQLKRSIDSWIERDGDVTLADLRDPLKAASQAQLDQIKVILGI